MESIKNVHAYLTETTDWFHDSGSKTWNWMNIQDSAQKFKYLVLLDIIALWRPALIEICQGSRLPL